MQALRYLKRNIRGLGPYACLFLLAAPFALAEPLKLVAIFVLGSGHWMTGLVLMVCAYALSVLVAERLFKILKPRLLTLRWFAISWKWFVAVRHATLSWLRDKWTLGRTAFTRRGVPKASTLTPYRGASANVSMPGCRVFPNIEEQPGAPFDWSDMVRQITSLLAASRTAKARRIVADQTNWIASLKSAGQCTLDTESSLHIYRSALKLLEEQEHRFNEENNAKRGETRKG